MIKAKEIALEIKLKNEKIAIQKCIDLNGRAVKRK